MATPVNRQDESSSHFRLITSAPKNRELTGAVDLLSYYGLREQYDKFCLKVLPASIGESHYLKDVVGDIDIRKGEDMELGQLLGLENENFNVHLHQFNIDILQQAFSFKESGLISLPEVERGVPTISVKMKEESKDKDRKHKKHKKHKDRHKDRDKDKDKDRHKDKDKEKDKNREKDRSKKENGDDHSRKHHKKKRKHEGNEEGEGRKHKKKKHKHSSKTEVPDQQIKR